VFRLDVRRCDRAALYTVGVVLHPLVVRHARSLSCFGPRKSLNCLWRIVCVQARIGLNQSTRFPCDCVVCALHCETADHHFVQLSASMCYKVLVVCDVSVFYCGVYGAQADNYRSDSSVRGIVPRESHSCTQGSLP